MGKNNMAIWCLKCKSLNINLFIELLIACLQSCDSDDVRNSDEGQKV